MAHILPDPRQHQCEACGQPLPRSTTEPSAAPGWTCPSCRHSYAPWVPECHHCPEPPAFTAKGNDPGPINLGPAL